jgi:hypothetical protein
MKHVVLVIASFLSLLAGVDALACSCAPHELEGDVAVADTVYFGVLISARTVEPSDSDLLGHYEVTFKVAEALKGSAVVDEPRSLIFLRCAVPLVIGDTYVVFEREVCKTTRCWGTDHFDRADWQAGERRKEEIRAAFKHVTAQ